MTVKNAKIKIDVEVGAEGAARGFDKLSNATDKSRKAVEKNDAALKAARLEYQVAQARAQNLAEAQAKLTAKTNEAAQAFARAGRAMASSNPALATGASGWGSLAAGAGKAAGALGLATAAGVGAASMASDLAAESLQVQGVFGHLPFSLNAAKEATHGLADSMTLARNAIMANQAGVATTGQAYGELLGMVQKLAFKTGQDLNESIERVTLGIAKQERELLDEMLPGLARMEDMWGKYAKANNKATSELTDLEKNAAFTNEVLEAMRRATQGVEVDMSGAAASIARTTVEVKNLRTAALGGVEAELSLAEGVKQLDVALLRQMKYDHGSTYAEIADALEMAGVNVEKYRNNNVALERDIRNAIKSEGRMLVQLAEGRDLTAELVNDTERLRIVRDSLSDTDRRILEKDIQRVQMEETRKLSAEAAHQAEIAQRNERILEIEEQLAFGRAAQISQAEINRLVAEEAELRAQVLEAEGKTAEAAEIRRKAMLEGLAAEGERSRPRRGGGRRSNVAEERERRRVAAAQAEREHWEHINQLMANLAESRAELESMDNPFTASNMQLQASVEMQERALQLDRERAIALAEIEERRAQREASGIEDPIARMEAETQARIALIDVRMRAANDDIAMADLVDQREGELHALAMTRLEERRRIEAEVHERRVGIAEESMDLAIGAATAIVQGAVIEGKALRGVVAATARGEAMRHGLILGPSALAQAAFHGLTGNIPLATALGTQAAQHFAFAGAMGLLAGAAGGLGGGGRGKSVSGGFGAEAFGAGPAANEPMGQRSATGGSWDIGASIPLSQETKAKTSASAMIGSAWSGSAPVQQNIQIFATGEMDDMTIGKIAKGLERASSRQGRLAAGRRF